MTYVLESSPLKPANLGALRGGRRVVTCSGVSVICM